MKALSIQQPWPYAIFHLGKNVENRTWQLRMQVPFDCLIHAGKTFDLDSLQVLAAQGYAIQRSECVQGALLGLVTITGCIVRPRTEAEHLWFCGPFGFTLANARLFEKPIPFKGRLGFFDVPDELLQQSGILAA